MFVPAGPLALQRSLRLVACERVNGAGQVGERLEVAAALELMPREQGREPHPARAVGDRRARQPALECDADVLELGAVSAEPGHAALDQKASPQQLAQEGRLVAQRLRHRLGHA